MQVYCNGSILQWKYTAMQVYCNACILQCMYIAMHVYCNGSILQCKYIAMQVYTTLMLFKERTDYQNLLGRIATMSR